VTRFSLRADAARRVVYALVAGILAAGVFRWVKHGGDLDGYVRVGRVLLEGGHIYRDLPPTLNTWPPLFGVLCVPLALLARGGETLVRAVWVGLNVVALGAVLRLIVRLVYDRGLGLRPGPSTLALADRAVLVPVLLASPYLGSNFSHLQVNLLLFGLALWGLSLQARDRSVAGGVALGLAAALKVMPILFLAYLVARRRFAAAAAMAVAVVTFSLSPLVVFGRERFVDYLASWWAAVARGWGVGRMNQSVFAMLDRLIGHGHVPFATLDAARLTRSGDPLVLLALGAVVAIAVASMVLSFRGDPAPRSPAALMEWGFVFVCAAILGPVTWKAYLVVLLLPYALLTETWRNVDADRRTRRIAGALLVVSGALAMLGTRELLRPIVGAGVGSTTTAAALVAAAAMLWLRARSPLHEPRRGREAADHLGHAAREVDGRAIFEVGSDDLHADG
jgi:hypothetical protein